MAIELKTIKLTFLLLLIIFIFSCVLSVSAGSSESTKARQADIEAQSAEIKRDAAVAMDISINALSNVIAAFNDVEKSVTVKLHSGNATNIKRILNDLSEAWKLEEDVLKQIEKISTYVSIATSVLNNVELQIKDISISPDKKASLKKADKSTASARKNVDKATELAEKLKQAWLVPINNETPQNSRF